MTTCAARAQPKLQWGRGSSRVSSLTTTHSPTCSAVCASAGRSKHAHRGARAPLQQRTIFKLEKKGPKSIATLWNLEEGNTPFKSKNKKEDEIDNYERGLSGCWPAGPCLTDFLYISQTHAARANKATRPEILGVRFLLIASRDRPCG